MLESSLAAALSWHITHECGEFVPVVAIGTASSLPAFIKKEYEFYECFVYGRRCVLLARLGSAPSPEEALEHVNLVRAAEDGIVIYVMQPNDKRISTHLTMNDSSYMEPGISIHLLELAKALQEHWYPHDYIYSFSPVTQVVLFHHLLQLDDAATTPTLLAERLHYTPASIGRAFKELTTVGFAHTERRGRSKHIKFDIERRQLFDLACCYLQDPCRGFKYVGGMPAKGALKLAGHSALEEVTGLPNEYITTFAIAARDWEKIAEEHKLVDAYDSHADCYFETWSYDPACLSDSLAIDPLSLYMDLRTSCDEREFAAVMKLVDASVVGGL